MLQSLRRAALFDLAVFRFSRVDLYQNFQNSFFHEKNPRKRSNLIDRSKVAYTLMSASGSNSI